MLLINGIHSTLYRVQQRLDLIGWFLQQEAGHKLLNISSTFIYLQWGRKRQEEVIEGDKTDKSTSALFDDLKHVYLIKSCLRSSSKLCSSFKQNMIQRVSGEEQSSKKGEKQDAAQVGKSLGQVKFWKLVMVLDIRGANTHWSSDILTASPNTQGLFYTTEA